MHTPSPHLCFWRGIFYEKVFSDCTTVSLRASSAAVVLEEGKVSRWRRKSVFRGVHEGLRGRHQGFLDSCDRMLHVLLNWLLNNFIVSLYHTNHSLLIIRVCLHHGIMYCDTTNKRFTLNFSIKNFTEITYFSGTGRSKVHFVRGWHALLGSNLALLLAFLIGAVRFSFAFLKVCNAHYNFSAHGF